MKNTRRVYIRYDQCGYYNVVKNLKTGEIYEDAAEIAYIMNQLCTNAEDLFYRNTELINEKQELTKLLLEKSREYLDFTDALKNAIEHERTKLGRSVLLQLAEALNIEVDS